MKPSREAEPLLQRTVLQRDLDRYGARPFLREWSCYAIAVYRFGQRNDERSGLTHALGDKLYWVAHRLVTSVTNIELPKEARFGPGLRIYHSGPVVVHPEVVAGANCTLRQGVTLGQRRSRGGAPTLGSNVELGAYSQVLGEISIGDRARIGALALVLDDVPPDGVALAPRAEIRGSHD